MSESRLIINKIFELDEQYKGGIIKAKNREDFIKKYLCSIIDKALETRSRYVNSHGDDDFGTARYYD